MTEEEISAKLESLQLQISELAKGSNNAMILHGILESYKLLEKRHTHLHIAVTSILTVIREHHAEDFAKIKTVRKILLEEGAQMDQAAHQVVDTYAAYFE